MTQTTMFDPASEDLTASSEHAPLNRALKDARCVFRHDVGIM